ncbi:diguanylate cyclase [Catenovulum agarivorans DS-2]|uniref:diguanylate cyclase n=1 Tax=Catenovulum agarivorans DS-2 TaxID=1328313 RepID=W7Q8G2_9ALTE|nr:diguanylate cyclase [Catenovulum agarivorans]EWH09069.1 diguanylate cyclase [Catenovulum agarivorans DS-2]
MIINLFALVGTCLTLAMGFRALLESNFVLAMVLTSAALIFFAAHLAIRFSSSYHLPSRLVLYSLSLLMLYLIYSGGVDNTGPLWTYILPPVALFLGGLSLGLFNIVLFSVLCLFLLYFNGGHFILADYTDSYKLRFILSFFTVTFLSCCYEYSRKASYEHIQSLSDKFEQLAKTDPLTGLANRREMMEQINKEYARLSRNNSTLSLLLLDVDRFKTINDGFGHDVGDIVLQELANIFTQNIRVHDIVARWGGEEFLIMLPDTNTQQAIEVAEKLLNKVATHHFEIKHFRKQVTVSIGVAELHPLTTVTNAVAKADKYLYQAKQNGRNQVCYDAQ